MNKLDTIETPEESSAVSEIRKKLKLPLKDEIEERDTEYETPEKPNRIVRLFIKRALLKERMKEKEKEGKKNEN